MFLRELSSTGNISEACKVANVSRNTFYLTRDSDKEFSAAVIEAFEVSRDGLEMEMRRRGIEGLVRKKFTRSGDPIIDPETGEQYVEREYSDQLLLTLAKAHWPEKYRDNVKHEHSGPDGGPIPITTIEIVHRDPEADNAETG